MKKNLDLAKKIFIDLAIGGGLFLGYILLSLNEWGFLLQFILLPVFMVIYTTLGKMLDHDSEKTLYLGFLIPFLAVIYLQFYYIASAYPIRAACGSQDSTLTFMAIAQEEYFLHNNSKYATTEGQLIPEGYLKPEGMIITIATYNNAEPKYFVATARATTGSDEDGHKWNVECDKGSCTWDSSKGGLQRKQNDEMSVSNVAAPHSPPAYRQVSQAVNGVNASCANVKGLSFFRVSAFAHLAGVAAPLGCLHFFFYCVEVRSWVAE